MEEKNEIKIIKNLSEINAKTENEQHSIISGSNYFIKCRTLIKNEEIEFTYTLNDLQSAAKNKIDNSRDKLRFLLNILNLYKYAEDYVFSLNPKNLYYDFNFNIFILERDIRIKDTILNQDEWLQQYKSLIGSVLNDNYTYEDFYEGGIGLLKKNIYTEKYFSLDSNVKIKQQLNADLQDLIEKSKKVINVNPKNIKKIKYATFTLLIISALFLASIFYSLFFAIPRQNKIIQACNYFTHEDYENVINSLADIKEKNLDKSIKYQLACSYVNIEALSPEQKKIIFFTLGQNSDEYVLNYWIELGRKDYDAAIDTSKKLSDSEMLLYALLKKKYFIQQNETLTGEEKEKELTGLNTQIEKLNEELNPKEDKNINENNTDNAETSDNTQIQNKLPDSAENNSKENAAFNDSLEKSNPVTNENTNSSEGTNTNNISPELSNNN